MKVLQIAWVVNRVSGWGREETGQLILVLEPVEFDAIRDVTLFWVRKGVAYLVDKKAAEVSKRCLWERSLAEMYVGR